MSQGYSSPQQQQQLIGSMCPLCVGFATALQLKHPTKRRLASAYFQHAVYTALVGYLLLTNTALHFARYGLNQKIHASNMQGNGPTSICCVVWYRQWNCWISHRWIDFPNSVEVDVQEKSTTTATCKCVAPFGSIIIIINTV